jgi:hypothetical protein
MGAGLLREPPAAGVALGNGRPGKAAELAASRYRCEISINAAVLQHDDYLGVSSSYLIGSIVRLNSGEILAPPTHSLGTANTRNGCSRQGAIALLSGSQVWRKPSPQTQRSISCDRILIEAARATRSTRPIRQRPLWGQTKRLPALRFR